VLILMTGMLEGLFTGKRLAIYINRDGADYWNARRVVNGTDRAVLIESYAERFEIGLHDAQTLAGGGGGSTAPTMPPDWEPAPDGPPDGRRGPSWIAGALGLLMAAAAAVAAWLTFG
jgi:hypothetical protein